MKNLFKKAITIALSAVMCVSLCSCDLFGGEESEEDPNKEHIYIYNFNAGYGTQWLYNAREAYEELHPEIQIIITAEKTGASSINSQYVAGNKHEIYFLENQPYYELLTTAQGLGDITDAVMTPNPYEEDGDDDPTNNKTIWSKLTESQQSYYKNNGRVYGLPHYAGNYGFIYNKDMFAEKGWYLNDTVKLGVNDEGVTSLADYFISEDFPDKSLGVDGKTGIKDGVDYSADDGLPSTYEEFWLLLNYMKQTAGNASTGKKIYPVTFTGQWDFYRTYTLNSLVADYEGLNNMLLNYTFNGTADDLITVDANGNVTFDETSTTITTENGYELARQAGKYYGLKFFENLLNPDNGYYDEVCLLDKDQNLAAQNRLIKGETAILMEGVWWEGESETAGYFANNPDGKDGYNFGWMPMPKQNASQVGTTETTKDSTIYDCMYSLCFTKPNMTDEQNKRVIDFIQFVYSDKWLREFTKETGALKAVNYTLDDDTMNSLTTYEKEVYNMTLKSNVIYPFSNAELFTKNQTVFEARYYYSNSATLQTPVLKFCAQKSSDRISAINYFNKMYTYYKDTAWKNLK